MNKQQQNLAQIIEGFKSRVVLSDDKIKSGDLVFMVYPMWFNMTIEFPILAECTIKDGGISFPQFGPDYKDLYTGISSFKKVVSTSLPTPLFSGVLDKMFQEEKDIFSRNALMLAAFAAQCLRK